MKTLFSHIWLAVALITLAACAPLNAAQLPGGFSQIDMEDGGYLVGLIQHGSGRLFCRTDGGGIYSSDNGGFRWNYLSGNMMSRVSLCVAGIAVPQTSNSSSNLVLQVVGNNFLLTDQARGIWKTTDGGATWTQTLAGVNFWGDGPERVGGEPVIFHPTNDLEAWAGSHAQGLYKSLDAGSTWTLVSGLATSNVYSSLYIHPSYPDQIFAAGDGGVWVSVNHGANWAQVASSPMILRVTRGADGTVYFGGQSGSKQVIQKITSTNWAYPTNYAIIDLYSAYVSGISPDADPLTCVTVLRDGRLVAGDYDYTRISSNKGASFTTLPRTYVPGTIVPQWSSGSQVDSPVCVVQDVSATNTWYGGGGNSPLRTDDGGQHWQFIFNGVGEVVTFTVGFHPTDPNRLYIPCADNGGAVVTDGGISGNTVSMLKPFFTSDGLQCTHRALVLISNGVTRAIFPGGEEFHNQPRIYVTTNDGTSWYAPAMAGLPTGSNGQIIIDAVDSLDNPDDFLVVCGGYAGTNKGGLYRTTNAGASFTQCTNWIPTNTMFFGTGSYSQVSLARDATNVNVRYMYSRMQFPGPPDLWGGLFRSMDRGVTWTQIPWPAVKNPNDWNDWYGVLVADRATSGSLWIYFEQSTNTYNGLMHSYDGGNSWYIVPGFTNAGALDARNGKIAVCAAMTNDIWCKIYYSTNNGTNWNEVTRPNYRFGNTIGLALDPVPRRAHHHQHGRAFRGHLHSGHAGAAVAIELFHVHQLGPKRQWRQSQLQRPAQPPGICPRRRSLARVKLRPAVRLRLGQCRQLAALCDHFQ